MPRPGATLLPIDGLLLLGEGVEGEFHQQKRPLTITAKDLPFIKLKLLKV